MLLRNRIKVIPRERLVDKRGWFVKVINGKESHLSSDIGEIYSILANPGETRANHYHDLAQEWFTLIQGKAELQLEDIYTKEKICLCLDSDNPQTIFVPNKIAHSFINHARDPFILIAYSDQQYDPADTIPYEWAVKVTK